MATNTPNEFDVSAIVPIFNGQQHVYEALESALNQTIPVKEIIVVNDGSTDLSMDMVRKFKADFTLSNSQLIIVEQENLGQGSARNMGATLATTNFIAFLDQDDTWQPNHVEKLMAPFEKNPTIGWVYSDFNELDSESRIIRRRFLAKSKYKIPKDSIFGFIHQDLMMLPSASILRKQAFLDIGGFDIQFRGYEDDDLFIRLLVSGWDFLFEPTSTLNYRIHSENSSRSLTFQVSRKKFFEKYKDFFELGSEYRDIYLHQHLGPRMIRANIQDAATAIRDDKSELLDFSRNFYLEVASFLGINFRNRLIYFLMGRKSIFSLTMSIRFRARNLFAKQSSVY